MRIRKTAKKLLSDLGCSSAELSIVFVDDEEIRSLNLEYRGKDYATDVLSFPQDGGVSECESAEPLLLGDVVISLMTAERQAQELEHELYYEVVRLLVHGTLHLIGYEHEGVEDAVAQEMFDREAEIILSLEQEGLCALE